MAVYWWCPVCGEEPFLEPDSEAVRRGCQHCGATRPIAEFRHPGPTCAECMEVGNDPWETADPATFRIRRRDHGEIDVCDGHFLIHLEEHHDTGLLVLEKYWGS